MSAAPVRCAVMRGGTSKGLVFVADDLPMDRSARDDLLLRLMGSPDPRQIDGLGGAHPLTSKVAIVSASTDDGADVDYLFLQVQVQESVVSASQTCGNMLAAVAPFALGRGLLAARDGVSPVRVRMLNTGTVATVHVTTPAGVVTYEGDARMSGVPGTAAPVTISMDESADALFPTGRLREELAGLDVTCVDNGMPSVLVRADALGCTGQESPVELEAMPDVVRRVRDLRAEAARAMGLDLELQASTVPKIVLVSSPYDGGAIATRSFIPVRVHEAIGVLGAASVAAAAVVPGTVAHDVVVAPTDDVIRVEHPSGFLDVSIALLDGPPDRLPAVTGTSVVRTARLLMDGLAHPAPPRDQLTT